MPFFIRIVICQVTIPAHNKKHLYWNLTAQFYPIKISIGNISQFENHSRNLIYTRKQS